MKFEKALRKYLEQRDISESTIATHINRLEKIKNDLKINKTPLQLFLKDYKKVINYIDNTYDKSATKKAYYISLYSFSSMNKSKINKKVIDLYKKKMEENRDINNEEREDNVMEEKDINKFDGDLTNIYKKKEQEIKDLTKQGRIYLISKSINSLRDQNKYLNLLLERVVLYLYFKMAPKRSDWVGVKMFINYTFDIDKENERNVLVFKKNKVFLVLNKYKNKNKLGKYIEEIKGEDYTFLKYWYNFLKNWYGRNILPVIFNIDGQGQIKELTPNAFSNYFKRLTKEYTGENININMARKIYETKFINSDKYKSLTNKEKRLEHNKLLHSTNTAQEYLRVKK